MSPTKSELIRIIDAASAEFELYLAGLTEKQMMDLYDNEGWNVRDHITHLAAWEQTNVMLLQGKPRFQFTGADSTRLSETPIDELNAILREHWKSPAIADAIEAYRRIHTELIVSLDALTDADLSQPGGKFFKQLPPDEDRPVVDILRDNADRHIAEHLPWIQAILAPRGNL